MSIITLAIIGLGIFLIFNKSKPITENVSETEEISNKLIEKAEEQKVEPVALAPKVEEPIKEEDPLPEGTDRFIISISTTNEEIAQNLFTGMYIKDPIPFTKILDEGKNPVASGAYKISKEMTEEQLNKVLHLDPYMKWIKLKEGLRKEEIAEILASTLGWIKTEKDNWINKDTATSIEYTEGVYYPDTYLIPVEEEPALVAKRLISKFNEKFASYLPQFTAKNIRWARALVLASIVQREAANDQDMPLIAGILWNRLDENMALGVDATLQYLRGDKGSGWWAPISVSDKQIDSPFNTYKYKGLPPHPISNPGVKAIEAVLNPKKTDCLYYLHDKQRMTHCAVTYEEHQKNIEDYLINQ